MMTINANRYYCTSWWNLLVLLLLLLWSSSPQNNDSIIVVSAFDITSVVTSPPPPVHTTTTTTTFHRHSYHPQQQQYHHLRYLQLSSSKTNNDNDRNGELDNNDDDTINTEDSKYNCRQPHQQNYQHDQLSRRHWLIRSTLLSSATIVTSSLSSSSITAAATTTTTLMTDGTTTSATTTSSSVYIPAIRPTVYRIDTTIPPTLLPVPKLFDQKKLLTDLGRGFGTDKKEVFIDRINLNNMLQKAVYGTIDAVKRITTSSSNQNGPQKAPASFVCFGLPMQVSNRDIELTVSLLRGIFEKRLMNPSQKQRTTSSAIGLAMLPCTAQSIIDDLIANRITLSDISSRSAGGDDDHYNDIQSLLPLYRPILEYAIENHIPIIAMGISKEDEVSVRKGGIQNVNPTSRETYVPDPNGFIAMTTDPKFQLYTDRSLLKDRLLVTASTPLTESISEGNYYAERILRHEAGATFVSQYAIDHRQTKTNDDCCLIAIVAPINDVRYLGGINGRIPRIYQYLSNKNNNIANESSTTTTTDPNESSSSSLLVSMNDITTILINPTAIDTLSRTVRLRLEIGTGPDTIPYQTKIADYLWFSSSPSVNLLPRVMDY